MGHIRKMRESLLNALAAVAVAAGAFVGGGFLEGFRDAYVIVTALLMGMFSFLSLYLFTINRQARAGEYTRELIASVLSDDTGELELVDESLPTCWEVLTCCYPQCTVYGQEHVRCWLVDGTFCRGEHEGSFPNKLDYCFECEVFTLAVRGDPVREMEERFRGMMRLLGDREKKLSEMYQRSEMQRQTLEHLLNMSRQALSSLELDALLELLMKQVVGPSADFAAFFIKSREGSFELRSQEGFRAGVTPKLLVGEGADFLEAVIGAGEVLIRRDVAREPWVSSQFLAGAFPTSVIGIPLVNRGGKLGVLIAGTFRDEPYSETERQAFQMAGDQIAMAVANASMYESVSRMAATDGLTGLANHRAFYEAIYRELERSRRYGRPVSLIMMDIDDFKQFNDRFGHPQGDKVLAEVAKIIRDSVRVVDTAARYGGEEFAVLLPETPYQAGEEVAGSAMQVGERIRASVEGHLFEGRPGRRDQRMTVSAGIAEYPAHADGPAAIVYRADVALYEAKRRGKNRVELASEMRKDKGVASAGQ
ncbi:MAG: sensor domain-containing diguanylate cyclase [Gaiellales bacterium]|nr:MAG: sensor domain-containing diguanylate cyclase [Gaiellales bacterium]